MRYWKAGCKWGDGNISFYEFVREVHVVFCSWEIEPSIGDLVAICDGFTVMAIGKILTSPLSVTNHYYDILKTEIVDYGIAYEDWNKAVDVIFYEIPKEERFYFEYRKGLCEIQKEEIKENINKFIPMVLKEEEKLNMQNYTKLLTTNRNLILTGAPGTGKTYLAKEISSLLCFDSVKNEKDMTKDEKKQIGFVQFHPSYDYTDFVEGLRPKNDDDGNVGFERKDGVFKEFCKRALKAERRKNEVHNPGDHNSTQNNSQENDNQINDFEERYSKFVDRVKKEGEVKLDTGTKDFTVSYNTEEDTLISKYHGGNKYMIDKNDLKTCYDNENEFVDTHKNSTFTVRICNELRSIDISKNNSDVRIKHQTETTDKQNFVFIIDEINRGEISKIFGELFFSIDPGYRGEKGRVLTQYQNLVTEYDEHGNEDPFTKDKCGFYVPENVYIIGTMNDIDRSVESMDFAFRRRFAFAEVKAKDTQSMLDKEEAWKPNEKPSEDTVTKIKNRMDNLNKAISDLKSEGLSSAYHIGASYFLKLQNYDGDFDELWEYHIEGLLREYLRGNPNADDLIGDLKSAYDNENPVTETQDDGSGDVAPANN